MTLGQKVKEAIEKSEFSTEEVASFIGISHTNLYRMYKKDSFEVKYLLKISEKLSLPLGFFLNDDTIGAMLQNASGKQVQQANKVGSNNQSINIGGLSKKECEEKLLDLQEKYDLAKKTIADKEMIIEMLKGQK